MNAYEVLKLKEFETDEQKIDILVKSRTRSGITSLIQQLNEKFDKKDVSTLKKLEYATEILEQLTYYVTACDCIESEEKRKEYEAAGMPDIEGIANNNRRKLFDANLLISNKDSQLTNAYQMLRIRNESLPLSFDEKTAIKDDYVRSRTLNLVKLEVDVAPLNSMEEIEKMIVQLLRYMWAYSKIDTREKRLVYTYKLYAKKGKEAAKSIVPTKKEGQGLSKVTDITDLGRDSEGYNLISIAQTNDFLYHRGVTPDDSIIASEYMITKQKSDGRRASYQVYSNINIDRLSQDKKYLDQVIRLLSDERLALGTRFFGGYIGDIINGRFDVSLEKVGICNKYAEKNREDKDTKKDKEKCTTPNNGNQQPTNPNLNSNQDPDDDFDI